MRYLPKETATTEKINRIKAFPVKAAIWRVGSILRDLSTRIKVHHPGSKLIVAANVAAFVFVSKYKHAGKAISDQVANSTPAKTNIGRIADKVISAMSF